MNEKLTAEIQALDGQCHELQDAMRTQGVHTPLEQARFEEISSIRSQFLCALTTDDVKFMNVAKKRFAHLLSNPQSAGYHDYLLSKIPLTIGAPAQ